MGGALAPSSGQLYLSERQTEGIVSSRAEKYDQSHSNERRITKSHDKLGIVKWRSCRVRYSLFFERTHVKLWQFYDSAVRKNLICAFYWKAGTYFCDILACWAYEGKTGTQVLHFLWRLPIGYGFMEDGMQDLNLCKVNDNSCICGHRNFYY